MYSHKLGAPMVIVLLEFLMHAVFDKCCKMIN